MLEISAKYESAHVAVCFISLWTEYWERIVMTTSLGYLFAVKIIHHFNRKKL
jgi:hypothetical protein